MAPAAHEQFLSQRPPFPQEAFTAVQDMAWFLFYPSSTPSGH